MGYYLSGMSAHSYNPLSGISARPAFAPQQGVADLFYFLQPGDDFVYHYTRAETAIQLILPNRTLRASPFLETNDPRESKDWSFDFWTSTSLNGADFNATNREVTHLIRSTCKVLCTSIDGEINGPFHPQMVWDRGFCRPRMWDRYAEHHRGLCLIFDRHKVDESLKKSMLTDALVISGPVNYRNRWHTQEEPFTIDMDAVSRIGAVRYVEEHVRRHAQNLFFEKATDWSAESEYRWVIWDKVQGAHAFEFGDSLKGIIVGPDFVQKAEIVRATKDHNCPLGQIHWKNGIPEVHLVDIPQKSPWFPMWKR